MKKHLLFLFSLCLVLGLHAQSSPGWGDKVNEDITDYIKQNFEHAQYGFTDFKGKIASESKQTYYPQKGLEGYYTQLHLADKNDIRNKITRNQVISKANLDHAVSSIRNQIKAALPPNYKSIEGAPADLKLNSKELTAYKNEYKAKDIVLCAFMQSGDAMTRENKAPVVLFAMKKRSGKFYALEIIVKSPAEAYIKDKNKPVAAAKPAKLKPASTGSSSTGAVKNKPVQTEKAESDDIQDLLKKAMAEVKLTQQKLDETNKASAGQNLQVFEVQKFNTQEGHVMEGIFEFRLINEDKLWMKKDGEYVGGYLKLSGKSEEIKPDSKLHTIKFTATGEEGSEPLTLTIMDFRKVSQAKKDKMELKESFILILGSKKGELMFVGELTEGKF